MSSANRWESARARLPSRSQAAARTFTIGNADRVSQDPQALEVVGKVRSAAYCAGMIPLKTAEALQRVHELRHANDQAGLATQAIFNAVWPTRSRF